MIEIIMQHPEVNRDSMAGFSYTYPRLQRRRFEELCLRRRITPATHPTVCDLFAGTGGMSAIVREYGWQGQNFTCIDKYRPGCTRGEESGGKWFYWDLRELAKALIAKEPLPKGVLAHKGRFDLVVMAYQTRLPPDWEPVLVGFFAKNGEDTLIVPDDWDWSHLLSLDKPRSYPEPLGNP